MSTRFVLQKIVFNRGLIQLQENFVPNFLTSGLLGRFFKLSDPDLTTDNVQTDNEFFSQH